MKMIKRQWREKEKIKIKLGNKCSPCLNPQNELRSSLSRARFWVLSSECDKKEHFKKNMNRIELKKHNKYCGKEK